VIVGVPAAAVYLSRAHYREVCVSWFQLVVLAVVQGITEFLPISSQGHLVLVPAVTGWPDQGLAIDVAVHVGTLGAVMVYFRRDLVRMAAGIARRDDSGKLALQIAVATVPVVLAGIALFALGAERLRSIEVIGWATLGFGVLLYAVDRACPARRRLEQMTFGPAALIGLAQVLALIPGTSRSGITMTAARALGFERRVAARFSMLVSIPVIIAAGTLQAVALYDTGDAVLTGRAVIAAAMAFVTALGAIGFLMRWLTRASFALFVAYRVVLGVALLVWVYA
jgi:undecaprenyl-diphosphatase